MYKTLPKFEKYDTISTAKKLKLFSNMYLPIEIITDTYKEQRTDNIVYENGDVFKITLHNVKNLNTNNVSDYSYRSIFYSVLSNDNTAVSSLNVDSDNITLKVGEVKQISVSIGPSNASNKLMNFISDNSTIAEVRQDGLVKAVKPGVTTITIECGNITKTVTVTVKNSDGSIPSYLRGDLNLNGVVEVADTIEALKYYVELIKLNDTALMIGDFNSNKKIDVSDAVEILKLYVNQ